MGESLLSEISRGGKEVPREFGDACALEENDEDNEFGSGSDSFSETDRGTVPKKEGHSRGMRRTTLFQPTQYKFRRRSRNTSSEDSSAVEETNSTQLTRQTQTTPKSSSIPIGSFSNYLNWRLIDSCVTFQLASPKDMELLRLGLKKSFAKHRPVSLRKVKEIKQLFLLFFLLALLCSLGFCLFGYEFFVLETIWEGQTTLLQEPFEALSAWVLSPDCEQWLFVSLFMLTSLVSLLSIVFSLMLVFKFFFYLRMSYLVSTLISSLEHSKLCIKNAVQYLSDYSSVNSGFCYSHRGLSSKVKTDAIEANVPLFRCLTENLILDILSCQDSCAHLPKETVQFVEMHLCETVDVEKIIATLQDNNMGVGAVDEDDSASSKLNTILQLHYELVTEFYFSLVMSLAHSFCTANESVTSEIFSVFKSFIVNYDLSISRNLERELDLVQDLFLGLDFEEDSVAASENSKLSSGKGSSAVESFERSNWKSVLTSFNIHLKEIAKLSADLKVERETEERIIEIVRHRLTAALSCVDNLQLMLRAKRKKNEMEKERQIYREDSSNDCRDSPDMATADATTLEKQYVTSTGRVDDFASIDDVFLGREEPDDPQVVSGTRNRNKEIKGHRGQEDEGDAGGWMEERRLMRSHKQILSELSSVMSQRVTDRKHRENVAIERKYGKEALRQMGWDATAATLFKESELEVPVDTSTMEASYLLPKDGQLLTQFVPGPSGDNFSTSDGHRIGARLLHEVVSEENIDLHSFESAEGAASSRLENVNSDQDLKSDNFNSQVQTLSLGSFSQNTRTYEDNNCTSVEDEEEFREDSEDLEAEDDAAQVAQMRNIIQSNFLSSLMQTSNSANEETFGSSSSSQDSETELETTFSSEETSLQ